MCFFTGHGGWWPFELTPNAQYHVMAAASPPLESSLILGAITSHSHLWPLILVVHNVMQNWLSPTVEMVQYPAPAGLQSPKVTLYL